MKKNEESLRTIWDSIKYNIVHIIGVPEGEESEKRIENLFEEIMAKNFHNLVKEKGTHVWEAQKIPIKMNPKKPTPRHIIIKTKKAEDKERL